MMDEEDLEASHHFLTSPDFDVKIGGGDSLSQGDYDSSDQEALLDDVIIAQKDTDSSSSSEDWLNPTLWTHLSQSPSQH